MSVEGTKDFVRWCMLKSKYKKAVKQGHYISGNRCPKCRSKMYWKDVDDEKEWCRSCGK